MTCRRFEEEALWSIEADEALDPHFGACAARLAAAAAYTRLAGDVARVGASYALPGDFEARVWAAIARGLPARQRRWSGALAALAAALVAATVLVVAWPRDPERLPAWRMRVSAGELPLRTDQPVDVPALSPGSRLHLTLQPEAAVTGPLAVRAWVRGEAGLQAVPLTAEISATGSIRAAVAAADLGGGTGRRELLVVVGRPCALPEAAAVETAEDAPHWRLFRQSVELRGP